VPVIGKTHKMHLDAVVYATDFSVSSQYAGRYAALLARRFSTRLFVTHAFTLSQAAMEVEAISAPESEQRKDLQLLLSREAVHLKSGASEGIPVLLEGDPREVIPEFADKNSPSLVVLGTHGGSWIEHQLIGSVAEAILCSARWPCLTVGPQVASVSATALAIHRILYATDFTPAAAHAAIYAFSLAEEFKAGVDILNVIHPEAVDHPDRLSELAGEFCRALDDLVPEKAKECCDPSTFVKVGEAHDRILAHIKERSIDILVLGIRKTSQLGMEMRNSLALRLIADAPCPVLTVTG
jgi:nucleotide-binding universal stress UspA family protein